jgi:hypothetical protein
MDPLFQALVVGLVPQPKQIPPAPFVAEDLQRAYFDVSKEHHYQQFQFLPGEAGAQFMNAPEDGIVVQPGLIQLRTPVETTPEVARERFVAILRVLAKRLALATFLQAGIKVVAHVAVDGSAKHFIGERLMRSPDHIAELGPNFFAGGVKFRSIQPENGLEENLLLEPFVHDDKFVFVDYDVQRPFPYEVGQVGGWLDEAFAFVRGPAMRLLEAEA